MGGEVIDLRGLFSIWVWALSARLPQRRLQKNSMTPPPVHAVIRPPSPVPRPPSPVPRPPSPVPRPPSPVPRPPSSVTRNP